jgi:hypothetical protein
MNLPFLFTTNRLQIGMTDWWPIMYLIIFRNIAKIERFCNSIYYKCRKKYAF